MRNNALKIRSCFKVIINLSILSCINTYALANEPRFNVINKSNGYCRTDSKNIIKEIMSLSGKDFLDKIANIDPDCILKISLASPLELRKIITKDNMITITNEALVEVDRVDLNSPKKFLNLVSFLNFAYFLQKENPKYINDFNIKYDEEKKKYESDTFLKDSIATIAHKYAIKIYDKKYSENLSTLSKQVFGLIESAKTYEQSLALIEYITLNSSSIVDKNKSALYDSILPIQNALASSHDAGGIYFKSKENRDKFINIVNNIINIVNNEINNDENLKLAESKIYRNYIRELGRFLRYNVKNNDNNNKERIIDTLKKLIANTSRISKTGKEDPSGYWVEAVSALEENKIVNSKNCVYFVDKYQKNICDAKSKLSKELFKNRSKYDEGNIIIFSSLDKNQTDKLYLAMKQVEAQYKRTAKTFDPVRNDPNERLQVFIYKNKEDYDKFKAYISDNDPEGLSGFYVEHVGSFYTFNQNNLEEIVRHEYVHYLNARYLVQGIDGDTSSFVKKWSRMKWFEEGSAEFFAFSTQFNGILKNKYNFNSITSENIRPIKEIVNSSLDILPSNILYPQSNALLNYLYEKERAIFDGIIASIKANNVIEFDNLMEKISNTELYSKNFKNYVIDVKNNLNNYNNLETKVNDKYFELNNTILFDIYNKIFNKFKLNGIEITHKKNTCELVASNEYSNSQARFACEWKLNNKNVNEENLNSSISSLYSDDNRFLNTNCMFNENTLYCEGPIKGKTTNNKVEIIKFDQLSDSKQSKIKISNSAQRDKTFKGSNEHFYFFVGDILSDILYTSQRRLEGQSYNYNVDKNTDRGHLEVNENGEITYENKGLNSEDYKKITGKVKVSETDKIKTPLHNDKNSHEINVNIFKFKEIDPRMFINEIYLDENGRATGSLYRDEYSLVDRGDGFKVIDRNFVERYMNDLDFELKNPNPNIVLGSRYMYSYSNPDEKNRLNDKIILKVIKHGNEAGEIEIKVKNKPNLTEKLNSIPKDIETHQISFKDDVRISGYIYSDIEHLLIPDKIYNYSIIKNVNCNELRLANYGAFMYEKKENCKSNKDYAEILIKRITNTVTEPVMLLKVNFEIN
nr:hypothetical protein GTC16762_18550 [Pigmentibacter ruber]